MTRQLSHQKVQSSLGAYALDAVELSERSAIESHLALCEVCRKEVSAHRETMSTVFTQTEDPPKGLWDSVLFALEEEPPPLSLITSAISKPAARTSIWLRGALAAAAIIVGVLSFKVVDQRAEIESLSSAGRDVSLSRLAAAALADPASERVVLRSSDEATSVKAVLLPDGSGYLVEDNLKPLSSDRTYQLWALVGDAKISLGVLGTDPDIIAFKVATRAQGLAITEEVAGGVATTTNPPVVVGFLGNH